MNHLQAVVTFRLDRLTRCGIGELLDVYRQFKKYHVKVYSVEEKHIDPDGDPLLVEFFLSGLAFAAAIESRAIGERVASGIATKRLEAAQRGEDSSK
jgi:DNA invertase Pin-like site-specific DNA recombinase